MNSLLDGHFAVLYPRIDSTAFLSLFQHVSTTVRIFLSIDDADTLYFMERIG